MPIRGIHVAALMMVVAVAFGAAACGTPEFTYVKNSDQKTYFRVPHDWRETGTDTLDNALSGTNPDSATAEMRQKLWWSVAYDASAYPTADHLLTDRVTAEPIVYARVAQLTEPQQNAVSLDLLRNVFLPVTDEAREAAAGTIALTDFELVHDEVLSQSGGLHGVRVIFDYGLGGVLHTFDQTALVNTDGSKLYLLIIRCSTSCYRDRSGELGEIAKSFTVRGK
jgi:hypothetical protein